MAMQAASSALDVEAPVGVYAPERSLLVASVLSMSGGFLDAFTWLSLGGVFANSQTGNVVFIGVYAMSGQWKQAAHHLLPMVAFLLGASIAIFASGRRCAASSERSSAWQRRCYCFIAYRIWSRSSESLSVSRCSRRASGRSSVGSISRLPSPATCSAPSTSPLRHPIVMRHVAPGSCFCSA